MNRNSFIILSLVFTIVSCTPSFKNDHSIGKQEEKAFQFLTEKLTRDMRNRFNGNPTQTEGIQPRQINDKMLIGIPEGITYSFITNDTKYLKGDLNHDKKWDLIIRSDFAENNAPENFAYFVFLQSEKEYGYYDVFVARDIAWTFCKKMSFKEGIFELDSISNGLFVGHSKYHKGDESYFGDYSYKCDVEKFRLNLSTHQFEMVSQSDLLRMNEKTGKYEKVTPLENKP